MMRLGAYRFSLDTAAYAEFVRTTEYRWVGIETHGGISQQFVGAGLDSVVLSGVIYPHFKGGLNQVDAMRSEAGKGVALLMTDGLGKVHGFWGIKSIKETSRKLAVAGVPRVVAFSLDLVYCGASA